MPTSTQNTVHGQHDRRRKARTKRVRHLDNLLWWIVLITALVATQQLPEVLASRTPVPAFEASTQIGSEKNAFISLVFGKISKTHDLAISDISFKQQLEALKQDNYSSVLLGQIIQWRQSDTTRLPTKPVLLTFEEANHETMEIADNLLAEFGMTALVFVDINKLNQGNIQLVSWHQLEQLVQSGRWEVGVSGCKSGDDLALFSPEELTQRFEQQREELERRLHTSVVAADCSHALSHKSSEREAVWRQALSSALFKLGFVVAPNGANYRNDSEFSVRRIRVSRDWDGADLLGQLRTHAPRLAPFVDTFQLDQPAPEWVVDHGEIAIEGGSLVIHNKRQWDGADVLCQLRSYAPRFAPLVDMLQLDQSAPEWVMDHGVSAIEGGPLLTLNKREAQGALVTLGGTENWQDADVQIRLKRQPEGQFWMILRYRVGQPFVRLGIADGQVLLQASEADGSIRQLASRKAPAAEMTLRLSVIGNRAIAYLDGMTLLARPMEVSSTADHGSLALAIWNSQNTNKEAFDVANATAYLEQVNATPLSEKSGIVASSPGSAAWEQLREKSEVLSMISPSYFAWIDGKPHAYEDRDATLETFSDHHRIKLLPALYVAGNTQLSESSALIDQALLWVANPAYQGLNVVLENSVSEEDRRLFLDQLSLRMQGINKSLAVTLIANKDLHIPTTEKDDALIVASDTNLLSAAPTFMYPLSSPDLAIVLQDKIEEGKVLVSNKVLVSHREQFINYIN
jgi:hypothetical protein